MHILGAFRTKTPSIFFDLHHGTNLCRTLRGSTQSYVCAGPSGCLLTWSRCV